MRRTPKNPVRKAAKAKVKKKVAKRGTADGRPARKRRSY